MTAAVHILKASVDATRVHYINCPTCELRRRAFSWLQDWYGWHTTCLKCGERWTDGEMMERPFKPRWRQESIENARQMMERHHR